MNNKGFTLIELLGVVAVLGIIAIITVPVINRSLSQSKENLYDVQIEQIKKGCQRRFPQKGRSRGKQRGPAADRGGRLRLFSDQIFLRINSSIAFLGAKPTFLATGAPFLKTITHGMLMIE